MNKPIKTKDQGAMKEQFTITRQACIACHQAEKMGFLNISTVFAKTEIFATHKK